jgi:hypothetical protein
VQSDPTSIFYVDVERAVALIDELSGIENPAGREKWMHVRDALNLPGLKRIIATRGFDGKDFATHAFIEAPLPHKGITALMDAAPLSDTDLKLVPADASTLMAASFDLAGLLRTIRDTAGEVDPQAKVKVDQGIGAVSMFVGKNLETEILDPLGEHWVAYLSPSVAGRGITGRVGVNHLKDAKKAEQGLNSLAIAVCNAINSQSKQKDVSIRFQQTKIADLNISYIAIPLVTPAWAVKDGNLYVGLYPQNVAAAARAAGADGKSILDNPDFSAMRKRLNVEKPTSFSYIDMRPTAAEGYQMVLAIMRFGLGLGDLAGVKSPETVLPPLYAIIPHRSPAGAASYVDEAGWHSHSVSPFPGAQILSGQQGMGLAGPAIAASLMLPAMSKAREQAQAVQSVTHLRQIALGCQMYATDHAGKLPPDLGSLASGGYIADPRIFLKPTSTAQIPVIPKDQQKDWVNKHADFVLAISDTPMKEIRLPSQTLLAYEKPGAEPRDRVAVAFVDGHSEVVPQVRLKQLLRRNELRN